MKINKTSQAILIILSIGTFIIVFFMDLITPLSYSHWLLYIFPLLIIYIAESEAATYAVLFFSAVALVIGFIYSPASSGYEDIRKISQITRITGFAVFFVFTIIINKLMQTRRHYKLISDRLEFANKELESFSYSAAHDLKTPLGAINGFSSILIEDFGSKLNKEELDLINRIKMNSEKMSMLINDMLRLSKVSLQEIKLQEISLSEIANTVADELKAADPQRKVKFIIESGLNARADKNLITSAISNLLGNAWKYTSKRDTAEIEFGLKRKDDIRVYYIKDNGCGFDMKDSARIFQPFKRLHPESEFPGTGIGMATVDRIIRRHGGRIWAEGEIDKGATFYFTLPE